MFLWTTYVLFIFYICTANLYKSMIFPWIKLFLSRFYVMFFCQVFFYLSKSSSLQWTFLSLFYLCVGIMWISVLLFATGKDCVCITLYSLDWTIPCNLTVPILCIIYIWYYIYHMYIYSWRKNCWYLKRDRATYISRVK